METEIIFLSLNIFLEPLEQFEIVKCGYSFWYNSEFYLNILNFFKFILYFNKYSLNEYFNYICMSEIVVLINKEDFINNIIQKHNYIHTPIDIDISRYNIISNNIITSNLYYYSGYDMFDDIYLFIYFNSDKLLWGYSLNSSFFFSLSLILIIIFILGSISKNLLIIPKNWQLFLEGLYKFVVDMLDTQVGKEAERYFPYIFTTFLFIIISNILGMTLFSFTLTSHIMVTFTLGVSTFIGLTILGFYIQKLKFLNLFLPQGIPGALLPMLIIIEIISYFSRALSLSIRLFANLMSGHTLLHILAFFSSKLFKFNLFIGFLSFMLILAIVALEFCIALLQAYVFAILICIYLNDSFHAGH